MSVGFGVALLLSGFLGFAFLSLLGLLGFGFGFAGFVVGVGGFGEFWLWCLVLRCCGVANFAIGLVCDFVQMVGVWLLGFVVMVGCLVNVVCLGFG